MTRSYKTTNATSRKSLYVTKSYELFRTAKVTDLDLVSKRINLLKETRGDTLTKKETRQEKKTMSSILKCKNIPEDFEALDLCDKLQQHCECKQAPGRSEITKGFNINFMYINIVNRRCQSVLLLPGTCKV